MQTERGAVLKRRTKLVALALLITGVDQLTKLLVVRAVPENESHPLIDHFLWLSHFRNSGVAFGKLRGFPGVLALVALVGVIAFMTITVREPGRWGGIGAAIVAGGALGNLIDRLARGSVVDFVDLHWWPAFNVADSAITIGAIVIILAGFFDKKPSHDTADSS